MATISVKGNVGRMVLVKRVYVKRPQHRYGQWHLAEFIPDENESREDCDAVGKLTGATPDPVASVAFVDPGSHEQTMLYAHIDDLEVADTGPTAPDVNCCWIGQSPDLESVMDYVRGIEQRLVAIEQILKPRDIEIRTARWPEQELSRNAIIAALTESANA